MKHLFTTFLCAACALQAGAATKTATLTLSAGTKYQHIDGFGGTGMNAQWGDTYTQQKVNMLWGTGPGQIGLNIMRVRINPNEGNWGEYGNPIKWARAINPDLQVFATPWTPPKMYKTQNTNKYQNDFGTWVWPLVEHPWGGQGSNGGAINPACFDDYADFLERYRQTMASKGCPIDIISIQNESDYTPTAVDDGVEHASYESCIYSPTEMAAMVKAARQKVDPSCKIMGPECFGWGEHTYNNALVAMPDAVNNIDVWGNHLYGTNDWSFVQNVTRKTGKHMWMTEFLINYTAGSDGSFTAEYEMIESIDKAMKAGYSAYVYYNMLFDFFACNHGGSDTQLWKRAYVFSHYAKYATGMTRIRTSLTDYGSKLKGTSAYISESGDTVSVFMLNTMESDTYNVTLSLPFVPEKVIQVVTGDAANALTTDMTDVYATGTTRPVVTLQPRMFYTFQFIKHVDPSVVEPATSHKSPECANPLSANHFMADPTAVEHEGRLYVYATNDQQEFDYSHGLQANTYGKINQLVCLSTADMVNWTDHGVIDVHAIAPWADCSWAPSVVSRTEGDGLTHFYLYFANGASSIGVLTATSPTGPWTDPLGHALIDADTPGLGQVSWIIDPGVGIKSDGSEAYLTFGGGDVVGTDLQPGNARIVKLGDDMTSLGSDIVPISAPCHLEANELNYISGKWVFSYCTRWNIASNWSSYSSSNAPSACSIVYMTSSNPLADNWSFRGELLPNPGALDFPYGNNHSHLQKFGNTYYMFYHTQWLEREMGLGGGYRNLQVNRTTVKEKTAVITALNSQTATLAGPTQLKRVNPYEEQSAAMSAIAAKNWWMVRGVDFAAQGSPARQLSLRVKGSGRLSVHLSSLEADPVATAEFQGEGERRVVVPLSDELSAPCEHLYFLFTPFDEGEVLSWQFSSDVIDGVNEIEGGGRQHETGVYDLQGRRVGSSFPHSPSSVLKKGIYVRQGKKVVK